MSQVLEREAVEERPSSSRAASVSSAAVSSAKKPNGGSKPKKGNKAAKRARALRVHRVVRWAIQLAFFVLAPSVFSAAFNGVKYVAGQIGLMQAIEPTSFVVLLVGVLLFTVVFGRFFCGYACAFGTLGDAVYALFTPVRKVLHVPDFPLPQKAQRGLQFVKFGILAAICVLCFTGAWQAISGYSPWTAFAGIVAWSVDGISTVAFVVLGVIVLGMALVKRFFCQFLCPLGAVFALLPVLPVSQFNRCAGRCGKRCGKCQAGCPVVIYPDGQSFAMGECISCGKCSDVCPLTNIGMIRIADPAVDAASATTVSVRKKVLLRGNEIGYTLLKAVLLLVLLWIVGALGFAPSFAETTGIQLPWG